MSVRADAVKVIVFLVVGALMGGLLWLTLGRYTLGTTSTTYTADFTDVSGLRAGDLVRVAGVRVGQVDELSMTAENLVRVRIDVDADQPLLRTSTLLVRYENLVGDRFVELSDVPGVSAPQDANAVIGPDRTVPALDLDVLLNGFKPLFQGLRPEQVNALAENIVGTLQGRAGTVESLLGHTASLTGTLADRDEVIGRVVGNLNTVLGTVDARDREFSTTIDRLQRLVSGLAGERSTIGSAITEVDGLAGDLSGLLAEARPPLRGTIEQLGRTATVLDENQDSLDAVLAQIPVAYQSLTRVGSYGSFFNFYLCSIQVKVTGPDGRPIDSPTIGSNQNTPRCRLP
ncbi:MCE family protein [Pseudonocardia parietis]|uniref:Phospholipid/cholesterol/gamma-HCH transport system substrate-binding protein n=1 Tax=Pseudonocardia parietis TaxID=570936 RepID=A0ABS4VLJ7_9PSEU|nr:MlaD family protein [Pseudonocardia parietis]MBP2364800.1 phospholipid/cholesterol/gamma-HCH transport system substrate-binding protein [Pseudonocardia parietis]